MKLLDPEELQKMVDYSFGDQSGVLGDVPNAYMKEVNSTNKEFMDFIREYNEDTITFFVDNIRLYRRPIDYSDWLHLKSVPDADRIWLNQFENDDLLFLCASLKKLREMKSIVIFTAFEDTPLDEYIWDKLPENVTVYAANGVILGHRVFPFPHGIERKMYEGYNHHELLLNAMESKIEPKNALLVAHRTDTGNRGSLAEMFKDWAIVGHFPYEEYLQKMASCKFVLCPSGNGIESARNWETLYMRRVPVMVKHPYMQELYKDFPVLWVDSFEEVTEQLLKDNDHLFEQAQKFDMELLDLDYWFNKCTK